jgi:hypothetical protein
MVGAPRTDGDFALEAAPRIDYERGGVEELGMKRFVIGFMIGIGLMYWYLDNADRLFRDADQWMSKSASRYRDDKVHQAADRVLGNNRH